MTIAPNAKWEQSERLNPPPLRLKLVYSPECRTDLNIRTFDSRNRSRVLSQTCTSDHIQFLGKLHTQTMSVSVKIYWFIVVFLISVKNYNDIRVPLVLSFLNFVGLLALSTFKTKTFTLNSIKFAAICNMRISGYQYILLMQKMVNIRVRVWHIG